MRPFWKWKWSTKTSCKVFGEIHTIFRQAVIRLGQPLLLQPLKEGAYLLYIENTVAKTNGFAVHMSWM